VFAANGHLPLAKIQHIPVSKKSPAQIDVRKYWFFQAFSGEFRLPNTFCRACKKAVAKR
jgi:hypothetical protein